MIRKIEKIIKYGCWFPLVFGLIGYGLVGKEPFWKSLYASIALYFVNPVSDIDNVFVLIAKYSAVVVIAGAILILLKTLFFAISHFFIRWFKDSTIIFSDDWMGKVVQKSVKHGYVCDVPEEESDRWKVDRVQNYILMFSDDIKNMSFYTAHQAELCEKQVYILLREMDLYLLKPIENSNIHFFNIHFFKKPFTIFLINTPNHMHS